MPLLSNLNLNGSTPLRVQPGVGEWGPAGVPSTRSKQLMRVWVVLAFVVALTVLSLLGYHFYKVLQG